MSGSADEPSTIGAGVGLTPMPSQVEAESLWRRFYVDRMVERGIDRESAQACGDSCHVDLSDDPADAADNELQYWELDPGVPAVPAPEDPPARTEPETHLCAGCHHRWDGPLKGVELCGDCWRKGQAAVFAGNVPSDSRFGASLVSTCRRCGEFIGHGHVCAPVNADRVPDDDPQQCSCWLGRPGATFGSSVERENCSVHGTRQTSDVVCEHGTAMDVHCCGCHSGFLFDASKCICF